MINKIDELLASCTDQEVARQINELDLKNWRGDSFTSKKVLVIRNAYHLKSRFERLRERGLLTAQEMAAQLDVSRLPFIPRRMMASCVSIAMATSTVACTNHWKMLPFPKAKADAKPHRQFL